MLKNILITLTLCLISAFSLSANAWRCKMHNARGEVWYGYGYSYEATVEHAKEYCESKGVYPEDCHPDWCSRC